MALSTVAAAVALAAPASADQTATVRLQGKAPAAVYASIVKAAHAVCKPENGAEIYSLYVADDCVKTTIAAALEKISDPALNQYVKNREAFLVASN